MKQAAAIIQSEGFFIDNSPLAKRASRIFERRSALGKAGAERLLKYARIIRNRAITTRVSSGPNSSADSFEHDWPQSSSRVQSRRAVGSILIARIEELFELNTTALILEQFGAA